jgi:hypothetical protein
MDDAQHIVGVNDFFVVISVVTAAACFCVLLLHLFLQTLSHEEIFSASQLQGFFIL